MVPIFRPWNCTSPFFTVYVFFQVWNQINCRSLNPRESGFYQLFSNPQFLLIASLIVIGQVLIVSVGVHFAMTGLGLLFFGAEGFRNPSFWDARFNLGPVAVTGQAVIIVGVSLALIGLLWQFFEHTLYGKALRATAVNRLGARLMGISSHAAGQSTFAMAALIAPGFAPIVLMRANDRVLKGALWSSAMEQAQTPLPLLRRAQARVLSRGVVAPLAYAMTAVLLATLLQGADQRLLSLLTLGLFLHSAARAEDWPQWRGPGREAGQRGLSVVAEPERALHALHALTQRHTAEWAVRPFIVEHPKPVFATLSRWVSDPSVHVRRLVSEGSRPRLPWGLQLKSLVADPSPTLPLLRALQDDPSAYVRRSVANHLNDIAKDHPAVLLDWLHEHLPDAPAPRVALLKHACRSLIKAGDAQVLKAWGLGQAFRGDVRFDVQPRRVATKAMCPPPWL